MLEQVLAQTAQPLVLPQLPYSNYGESNDNGFAPSYHISPSHHSQIFSDSLRSKSSYIVNDFSSIVSSAIENKLSLRSNSDADPTNIPGLNQPDQEAERREYERQLTESPALSPPASSPSSATHRSAYNYDHRPSFDQIAASPSPDVMYNHSRTDDHIPPNELCPHTDAGEVDSRTSYASRPSSLPSIQTAGLGTHPVSADTYSASPLSSPQDLNSYQSLYRNPSFERYTFPPQMNTLDRRMSEPVIRSLYTAHAESLQYPPHPSSASNTAVIPTPHSVSPRPPSTYSTSFVPSSLPSHQRVPSGASVGSGSNQGSADSWIPLKHPQRATEEDLSGLGDSPTYSQSIPPSDNTVQGIAIGTSSPSRGDLPEVVGAGNGNGTPGGAKNDKKTYSFVSLPGNAVKKRPRRRYDEIERLYQCNYPNCSKAYGTLNHLNAHVTMQKHGAKRSPGEFKELRKQWRQAKKEAEEHEREREREARAALSMHHATHPLDIHPHLRGEGHLRGDGLVVRHPPPRRRISLVDPYPDPHGFPAHHHSSSPHVGSLYGYGSGASLDNPNAQARFGLHASTDDLRYPSHPLGPDMTPELPGYYRQHQNNSPSWHGGDLRHHQPPHHGMSMSLPSSRTIHQAAFFHHHQSSPPHYNLPPEHQPGEDDLEEPLLTSHVSLGSNRLPPDSTLLTPLPGFVPDSDQPQLLEGSGGVMGAMNSGMAGGRYDPSYGMGRDRDDF